MTPTRREALETRKRELEFLGTSYAMNGVEPPPELGAEYARVLAELAEEARRAEAAPVAPRPRSAS